MKSGIRSIGPGRYNATSAVMCSMVPSLNFRHRSRMPADSNWNTPTVWPLFSRSYAFGSSVGTRSTSTSTSRHCFTISQVLRMTVNVFSPRKSIFNRPRSSTGPIGYWVVMAPFFLSGKILTSGSAPMTTPAAWTEELRVISSSTNAVSINSRVTSSLS